MGLPSNRTAEVLIDKVPIRAKGEVQKHYVIGKVPIDNFSQGDTLLLSCHVQTSVKDDQNQDRQLTGVGLYTCDSLNGVDYGYNGAQLNNDFRDIVRSKGLNVDPKMHHYPFHITESFDIGSQFNKWAVVMCTGNVRNDSAPDSHIVVDYLRLSATKIS